jgi:hypothetical protein
VDDGLLASSQPGSCRTCTRVLPYPAPPSGDGVRDVVAVLDHDVLRVKAGVAAAVGAWGVEVHLVDVDSGGGCLSRYGDPEARSSYETGDEKCADAQLEPPSLTARSVLFNFSRLGLPRHPHPLVLTFLLNSRHPRTLSGYANWFLAACAKSAGNR